MRTLKITQILVMFLVAFTAGCSRLGSAKTSIMVILGPGGLYYPGGCAVEAFERRGGKNDYGIFRIAPFPNGALANMPPQGSLLSGNFDGVGPRTIRDDSSNAHTAFTVNVMFHEPTRDAILTRMRQLGCFEFG